MWHCPHSPAARLLLTAGRAAVDDISYPTSSQQQTNHSAYGSRMEQTDRQTDRRTDARELQMQRACSVYYAGSAKKHSIITLNGYTKITLEYATDQPLHRALFTRLSKD